MLKLKWIFYDLFLIDFFSFFFPFSLNCIFPNQFDLKNAIKHTRNKKKIASIEESLEKALNDSNVFALICLFFFLCLVSLPSLHY